jgi:serine/threonine-protein kinase RsbW
MAVETTEDRLTVTNRLSELGRVSAWIQEWTARNGIPADVAQRLDLCSAELVTNIVSHAFDDNGTEHSICLALCREAEAVRLEIEDDGRPFDPAALDPTPPVPKSIEEARVGGWGLTIVHHIADHLCYRRTDGRNRLTLRQRCRAVEPP